VVAASLKKNVAQALCMTPEDFARAFEAFSNKRTPAFQGN